MVAIKNSGVYAIINKIDGKIYIGSSCDLTKRKYTHLETLKNNKHTNHELQKAFNEFGRDNFEWKVLAYCSVDALRKKEQILINQYNSTNRNCGYNLALKTISARGPVAIIDGEKKKYKYGIIERLRREERLSQTEAAEISGINVKVWNRIENGYPATMKTLARMAKAIPELLNVTIDELLKDFNLKI